MEQLDYNSLYGWFAVLSPSDTVWNRNRVRGPIFRTT
jgi:hypothetical protein